MEAARSRAEESRCEMEKTRAPCGGRNGTEPMGARKERGRQVFRSSHPLVTALRGQSKTREGRGGALLEQHGRGWSGAPLVAGAICRSQRDEDRMGAAERRRTG